ncbi:MAG: SDR family oxidoreductase [Pyrinomonadaceae bacterium]|nr:SDR family oxidoreductase [Pyrinomonadaceae bacterium]
MSNLQNKIAIVTGGTKGIGRAIAESLLRGGAKVFITARNHGDISEAVSDLSQLGAIEGEACDVRSETQVKMMIDECERKFGGVDILINNAGIGIFGNVEELAPEDFRAVLETNVFGVFYACHFAIPLMKKRGGGYIINISSLAGANAHPKMSAYNASKFGLNGFSEAMMQEVRQDNIKVSYVMPGSVNTEFGGGAPKPDYALQSEDVAQVVIDLLEMPERALPSRVELRPSKPPVKK